MPCRMLDRKSTRLNSSHLVISYAVFCLKKKNQCKPGPQGFLSRRHLEIDLRSDAERLELPGFELSGNEYREVFVPRRETAADPAWPIRDRCHFADHPAPLGVRETVPEFPEETAEAIIAEAPI